MKNYLYYLLFLTTLLFITTQVFSQTTTLTGTVKESEGFSPVGEVVIHIEQTNQHSHTDLDGSYVISGLKEGNYKIQFSKLGFKSQEHSVLIRANETNRMDVFLEKTYIDLQSVQIAIDRPVSAASSKNLSQIDFENRPKNSAQDMLKLVPGLFIAQHAGGGKAEQIFVRGFDCDHGTDVAAYVDGIPVNMPSHAHGQGYADLHFLIPETVERVQIFKGPYSPRFGNFATGAAVEFETLDSLPTNLIQLESAYTPAINELTGSRGLVLLQLPQMASNVKSYFAADVVNNRSYFEADQKFKRISLFSKTTFAISSHSHLHLSVGGFGSSWDASGQIPESAVQNNQIGRFGSIDDSEGGTTQRNNLSVTYHTQYETSEFEVQAYTCNYRFRLYSNFTFYLIDTVNGDEIEQNDDRNIMGVNAVYSKGHKLGSMDNKLTIGASFRSDNIENQLWHAVKRKRLEQRVHANIFERSTGIFINEIFRFGDKFKVELGGRYDYFVFDVEDLLPGDSLRENYSGYNYQDLLSPKLNVSYSPNQFLQLFFNAGSGFHSNDARTVVRESTQHDLPRAIGAELGLLKHFGRRIVVSAALWWMDIENELVYVGDEGTTENKGPSRRAGIDCSARMQITKWLFADVDLNVAKNYFIDKVYGTRLTSDYHLPLAPNFTSSGGLTFKPGKKLSAGLRYRHLASRPANESNTVVTRAYTLYDMTANYKLQKIQLGLIIENLLDSDWNEAQFDTESRLLNSPQVLEELHFTPGTPFTARITVGYTF
ncbi:MAG: TonB-dependent receptor [Bacteroidota bacterium]|nr:TonB-dependent receptor [Bacteroidota bacterium]